MSLEGFLRLIDRPPVQRFLDRKREELEDINPRRIYVENVRAFFGFPYTVARWLLEAAVREGALIKRIGVLCPRDRHIVQSFESEESVPDSVYCFSCEAEGRDESSHPRHKLGRLTFYQLASTARDG